MKKTLTLFLFFCLFFVVQATEIQTVNTTSGNLATDASAYLTTVTNLAVTGTIDARDFVTMRDNMPLLAVLDLSGATIAAGTNIPGTVGTTDYPANEIPQNAFSTISGVSKTSLTSIAMPSSITSIGNFAFCNCWSLAGTLMIPSSVTSIGDNAFQACSGFTGSLTIPSSVTSIGDNAFSECAFTGSLTIPSSVTSIGNYAFAFCSGFTGSLTIPSSVTTIGTSAFYGCRGFSGSLTIPSSVTSIGDNAFLGCSGFTGSLTIPSSVTSIGSAAFINYSGLIEVDVANPNYSSADGVLFNKDKTILIQCPTSKTGSWTISSSVTSIGASAFYGCSGFTGALTIPSSVTSIGASAFYNCSGFTGALTIPSSLTSIGNNAFYGCSGFTGALTIPSSVTTIGSGAFNNCIGLTGALTIPTSVTSIEAGAFNNCRGFTGSLTIPSSITSIGKVAFRGCSNISSIKAYGTTPGLITLGSNVFSSMDTRTCVLNVPVGTLDLYAAAAQWNDFTIMEGIPSTITTQAVSAINPTTATGNGNITELGSPAPIAYGVCWNTAGTPTTTDNVADNVAVSATGAFTAAMTGLTANTTYYVRAFATNSTGTSYGNEVSFMTMGKNPQTITFNSLPTKTYGDAMFNLAATSTSGLALSYTSDNAAVATVSGNTVTIVGAGKANITASQAGDATSAVATNVIQQLTVTKKAITVTAVADTKTYDGTTASNGTATVGVLAAGDVINAAPTQTFDNVTVGTTHVLVATGLTIKNGSTDVTGNYNIQYVSAGGSITAKALTITLPNLTLSKVYDGNNLAIVSAGTLSGVIASDAGNVTVTALGSYDNASVGTNKTITIVYTLSGSAAGNYSAPADFRMTAAQISIISGVNMLAVSDSEGVTAYPTQVAAGQACAVKVTGIGDSDLQGAVLNVYTIQGVLVYHSTKVELFNSIYLPSIDGMYLGRVTTTKGKEFQFKVIVTK